MQRYHNSGADDDDVDEHYDVDHDDDHDVDYYHHHYHDAADDHDNVDYHDVVDLPVGDALRRLVCGPPQFLGEQVQLVAAPLLRLRRVRRRRRE